MSSGFFFSISGFGMLSSSAMVQNWVSLGAAASQGAAHGMNAGRRGAFGRWQRAVTVPFRPHRC
jgi:hypothetical protein